MLLQNANEDQVTENTPPKFDFVDRDRYYWSALDEIVKQQGFKIEDVVRNWSAYALRRDLIRFLSHYELFKLVADLPGSILELGVFRGASFFTWSNLLETFCPFDRHRKVFGFDTFEGLGKFTTADNADTSGNVLNQDPSVLRLPGAFKSDADMMLKLTEMHNADSLFPNMDRSNLIIGDVLETLPKFLDENPGLRLSLVYFDVDLYEPTKKALELLYPRVVEGGVLCFDEYSLVAWPGETQAVDEFLSNLPSKPIIRKFPWAQTPSGYFIKGQR